MEIRIHDESTYLDARIDVSVYGADGSVDSRRFYSRRDAEVFAKWRARQIARAAQGGK